MSKGEGENEKRGNVSCRYLGSPRLNIICHLCLGLPPKIYDHIQILSHYSIPRHHHFKSNTYSAYEDKTENPWTSLQESKLQ
jgi:hypothetical protein